MYCNERTSLDKMDKMLDKMTTNQGHAQRPRLKSDCAEHSVLSNFLEIVVACSGRVLNCGRGSLANSSWVPREQLKRPLTKVIVFTNTNIETDFRQIAQFEK